MKRRPPKSDDPARPWRHVRLAAVQELTSYGRWEWTWVVVKGLRKLGLRIPVGRDPRQVWTVWEFKLSGGSWIRRAQADEGNETT